MCAFIICVAPSSSMEDYAENIRNVDRRRVNINKSSKNIIVY